MDRAAMEKRVMHLLTYVKETDFDSLMWCMQQYAAQGMNEKKRAEARQTEKEEQV